MSPIAAAPSRRRLPGSPPPGVATVLQFLVARYPGVGRATWEDRFARGLVRHRGRALPADAPFVAGLEVEYFREVAGDEPRVRDDVAVVFEDDDLLVVDKPHFLPVIPTGPYVRHCLLELLRGAGRAELAPLHRIDRDTAGLVALSRRAATRAALAAPFGRGAVRKSYRALCELRGAPVAGRFEIAGRIVVDEPFWRRRLERGGPGDSLTRVRVLRARGGLAYLHLVPATGRTHQLRVHLAAAGCPVVNDRVYGLGLYPGAGEIGAPLQLLARTMALAHPFTGRRLVLRSRRALSGLVML